MINTNGMKEEEVFRKFAIRGIKDNRNIIYQDQAVEEK